MLFCCLAACAPLNVTLCRVRNGARRALHGLLLAGLASLGGCATYSASFKEVERDLAQQKYDAALKTIEKRSKDTKERTLYLLDKGMVQRMQRDFVGSNQSLEAAKQEMERLYAASISENALSFIINDATVSYAGDDYEQVLVHLYMALNYLELGQRHEARVEALQVDLKLREIAEKLPDSRYTEDALSRYLSGLIYEELGETSDAMIAYRKAYEAYQKQGKDFSLAIPEMLKTDLLRLSQRLGLRDELARYRKEFALTDAPQTDGKQGELVFVFNNGLAPIKREHIISTWAPVVQTGTTITTRPAPVVIAGKSSRRRGKHAPTPPVVVAAEPTPPVAPPVLVSIALPYYESRTPAAQRARLRIDAQQVETQLMEDIDGIARTSLNTRMPAITARAAARAIAKGAIQRSVDRATAKDDSAKLIGSLLVRVASVATERADTRSWLTLPANVQLARIPLPPGSHQVTLELLDAQGAVIGSRVFPSVTIREAGKTYLSYHAIP